MAEIRAELSEYPVKTRVMLSGPMVVARDIAHAKIKERLDAGEPMPQYLQDHKCITPDPQKLLRACHQVIWPHNSRPHGLTSSSSKPQAGRSSCSPKEIAHDRSPTHVTATAGFTWLNRRPRCPTRSRQHHLGWGSRISRTGYGSRLEDRSSRLSGLHRC